MELGDFCPLVFLFLKSKKASPNTFNFAERDLCIQYTSSPKNSFHNKNMSVFPLDSPGAPVILGLKMTASLLSQGARSARATSRSCGEGSGGPGCSVTKRFIEHGNGISCLQPCIQVRRRAFHPKMQNEHFRDY